MLNAQCSAQLKPSIMCLLSLLAAPFDDEGSAACDVIGGRARRSGDTQVGGSAADDDTTDSKYPEAASSGLARASRGGSGDGMAAKSGPDAGRWWLPLAGPGAGAGAATVGPARMDARDPPSALGGGADMNMDMDMDMDLDLDMDKDMDMNLGLDVDLDLDLDSKVESRVEARVDRPATDPAWISRLGCLDLAAQLRLPA
ncbi:hypothetical protein B2J93_3417 [Marssonina coronariae]|uniref:Uncharacterized protein n=1 Tax=Diplocarpon coronariae TaxID=2795749 RepID=A0A218Z8R5_9HELO|nr:hypothetical protein B2J93_3417 [Marssonina coronariae]